MKLSVGDKVIQINKNYFISKIGWIGKVIFIFTDPCQYTEHGRNNGIEVLFNKCPRALCVEANNLKKIQVSLNQFVEAQV